MRASEEGRRPEASTWWTAVSGGEKLKKKGEVRGMEGRRELFTEDRLGGREWTRGMSGEIRDNVRGEERGRYARWGGRCLKKGVNKEQRERGWDREKDESRRWQRSEFIFINGQRAERELLKRKKMNERMSGNEGRGDKGRCDACSLPAFWNPIITLSNGPAGGQRGAEETREGAQSGSSHGKDQVGAAETHYNILLMSKNKKIKTILQFGVAIK